MKTNRDYFKENKYVYVPKAVSQDICQLATQYGLFDSFTNFNPDKEQVVGAHFKYGDPLMESLLMYVQPIVEDATGLELYPTYSFYRTYKPGDELTKHVDRPSCEISLSLCLGYNYVHHDPNYKWDLFVGSSAFSMEPGDMAIYRGLEVEHWREPFQGGQGTYQVQAFLHYVDANGKYAFLMNDTRPALGVSGAMVDKKMRSLGDSLFANVKVPPVIVLERGE